MNIENLRNSGTSWQSWPTTMLVLIVAQNCADARSHYHAISHVSPRSDHTKRTWPFRCVPIMLSITRVPKPCCIGGFTAGPFVSVQLEDGGLLVTTIWRSKIVMDLPTTS